MKLGCAKVQEGFTDIASPCGPPCDLFVRKIVSFRNAAPSYCGSWLPPRKEWKLSDPRTLLVPLSISQSKSKGQCRIKGRRSRYYWYIVMCGAAYVYKDVKNFQ